MLSIPMSPISKDSPPTPSFLPATPFQIRKIFHRWRCFHYRSRFSDTNEKNRMGEKLTAANLMKGRKANYAKSVSHPFLGDYVRLRSNSEWRRVAKQDNSLVFADIVNKISRSGGKVRIVANTLSWSSCGRYDHVAKGHGLGETKCLLIFYSQFQPC